MQLMEEKLQARGLEVEELAQRLAAAEALISQLTAQVGEEADSLEASAERWGEGAAAGDTDDATVRALVLEPLVAAAAAEGQAGEEAPQPQLPPELQPEQQAGEQQAPPELQPEQQGAGGEAGTPVTARRPTSSPTPARRATPATTLKASMTGEGGPSGEAYAGSTSCQHQHSAHPCRRSRPTRSGPARQAVAGCCQLASAACMGLQGSCTNSQLMAQLLLLALYAYPRLLLRRCCAR